LLLNYAVLWQWSECAWVGLMVCVGVLEMAVKYVDFKVTGDPARARAAAERALTDRKFKISWQDEWSGTAERGSKTANVLLGAMAQYFAVGVKVRSSGPEETVIRIERLSTGWMGGAIGASRTTKNMSGLATELETTFTSAGVLLGVTQG